MKGQESISGGVDFTGLREIKYLQSLRSGPGIVGLLDVFIMNEDLCLVLEYCPWDLQKVCRGHNDIVSNV
jgi:serine/threonine protein kinase